MGHSKVRRTPMAIDNRNLAPGTQLTAMYKGTTYQAEVVQTEQGTRYRLADGREFKSPSSAGTAITGKACNGWAFWSLAGEATSSIVTPAPRPRRARKPRTEAAKDGHGHTLPIIEQTD